MSCASPRDVTMTRCFPTLALPGSRVFLAETFKIARGLPAEPLGAFQDRLQRLARVPRVTGERAQLLAVTVTRANETLLQFLEADEAMRQLAIDALTYRDVVRELEALDLVTAWVNGNHPSGYGRAITTPSAFVQLVGQVLPDVDVRAELARLLAVFPRQGDARVPSGPFLALGVPAPRVQWLMEFLRDQHMVELADGDGRPLLFYRAELLTDGRRALRGELFADPTDAD